jgi:hypothetical protein
MPRAGINYELAFLLHGMFSNYPGDQETPDWKDVPKPRKGVWLRYAELALKEATARPNLRESS